MTGLLSKQEKNDNSSGCRHHKQLFHSVPLYAKCLFEKFLLFDGWNKHWTSYAAGKMGLQS